MRGATADAGFRGEMSGIDWRMADTRKYMLAYLLN